MRLYFHLEIIRSIIGPNCSKRTRAVIYKLGTGGTYGCFDILEYLWELVNIIVIELKCQSDGGLLRPL